VHPELFGRPGEVAAGLGQDPADEAALELAPTIVEVNAALDHLVDQAIQQFLHGLLGRAQACARCVPGPKPQPAFDAAAYVRESSAWPVRRSKASRYFARVFITTSSGSDGTGGCLFHLMASR